MSDSDDTDVLLLIPPDFFLIEDLEGTPTENCLCDYSTKLPENNSMSSNFLHVENQFSTSPDISTISNCTVRSNCNKCEHKGRERNERCSLPTAFAHSTPKYTLKNNKEGQTFRENEVLREINHYLDTEKNPWAGSKAQTFPLMNSKANSLPISDVHNDCNFNENQPYDDSPNLNSNKISDDRLISLQELWGGRGCDENASIREERLRRQHCEKTIRALQAKLLEYQQKISVAIQIDRTKDLALEKLKEENLSIRNQTTKLEEKIHALEKEKDEITNKHRKENNELKIRNDSLEKELAQALDLAAKSQNKNDALEIKIEDLNKAYAEIEDLYKKKIKDLEDKVANYQHMKNFESNNLDKVKDQLNKAQIEAETVKTRNIHLEKQFELLQGEIELLKQQRHNSYEKFREEKDRASLLDKENKCLLQTVSELSEKEKKFLKELESQRVSLKSHYQKQLEEVVSQKLKEFQTQLDFVEESLRSEAKERECLIAERAIKQMELINDKNEQEIKLLNEKHHEEVELYRIQLLNATKKIEELEEKLRLYKSKRADIAEKLHSVMETQWKKALEILTSPSANTAESFQSINPQNIDQDRLDGVNTGISKHNPENESFDTPTSSRNKKYENSKSKDRLHAYIELLLSKSPKDLENLEEILLPKKCEKSRQRTEAINKPPWK